VYEILAAVTQGKSWEEAFLEIIPERKGAILKQETKDEISEDTSEKNEINQEAEPECNELEIKQETKEDNEKAPDDARDSNDDTFGDK